MDSTSKRFARRRACAPSGLATTIIVVALCLPTPASAHVERPSYWPDPAPDTSVSPPAGGKVPKARSLSSAVSGKGPGNVHVVCKGEDGARSLELLRRSVHVASTKGFRIRPSQPKKVLSDKKAHLFTRWNRELAERCDFSSIQAAVNEAGNNDRVVIMPGRYTEPKSRKAPLNDPRCNPSLLQEDASGDLTPSYEYQATCPNDQNLVYIQGRKILGEPLEPPREDRAGIPQQELGPCVRCNLQIEGSGPRPVDVIIDGGAKYSSKHPEAKPGRLVKDVILRADRADGIVIRNLLTRAAKEHGIYVEETDGYRIERTKMFWAADYNNLTFTSDHGLYKNCDGFGAGDSVIYPGAAPETGAQATDFYPDAPRINTTITKCDMRGSALGYSGSMGNAVRITNSHIYGNTTGIASDTLSAAGHPGFPADSSEIDHNLIYSNNLDLYREDAPVEPIVPVPIGTGIIYAGMNDALVHHNWIFDNWADGTLLLAVPDAITNGGLLDGGSPARPNGASGAEGEIYPGVSCPAAPENGVSTSCNNRYFENQMGRAPRGFKFPRALDQFGVAHGKLVDDRVLPNGNDFWWDEFSGNTRNCWFSNTGPDGTAASITGPGPGVPPDPLPSDCASSTGNGDVAKEAILVDCANGPDEETGPMACDWWRVPPKPQSRAAARHERRLAEAAARWARSAEADEFREALSALGAAP